jgi:predicted transposase/invertase (TIGR01784 family)
MSDIASIHDNFIRGVMADKSIAVNYFQSYLPAFVSGQLDFTTLTQLPDVYVSGELKKSMSDIVYSCQRKDRKDEVKVSLLIEHKSYVDVNTSIQIGSYIFSGMLKQVQNKEKISLIIPILLYHGADKWVYHTLGDLFKELEPEWRKYLPDFDYIYNNLGEVPDEQINALDNVLLQASLLALKHAFDPGWLAQNAVRLFILYDGASSNLTRGFALYLSRQGQFDKTKITEIMEALPPAGKETTTTIADYFQEQGYQKGHQKGRDEALAEKNRIATINMIRKGYADAEICEVLEVTVEYVTRIRAEVGAAE